ERLRRSLIKFAVAGLVLAAVLWLCQTPVSYLFSGWHHLRNVAALVVLAMIGGAVYIALLLMMFGRQWFMVFQSRP
ncbi:MAG TPA: hypothetical protein VMI47_07320, partial [Pseudolabrys sp.]|nr:hypothetical protein [Pseudolabrys sp.]